MRCVLYAMSIPASSSRTTPRPVGSPHLSRLLCIYTIHVYVYLPHFKPARLLSLVHFVVVKAYGERRYIYSATSANLTTSLSIPRMGVALRTLPRVLVQAPLPLPLSGSKAALKAAVPFQCLGIQSCVPPASRLDIQCQLDKEQVVPLRSA